MNKKTISFYAYQAYRLEQWAENRYVTGIIIIKSPGSSTEELNCKPLSFLLLIIFTQWIFVWQPDTISV